MRKVNPTAVLVWVVIAVVIIWIRSRPSAPSNVTPEAQTATSAIPSVVRTNPAGLSRAAQAAGARRTGSRTNAPGAGIERVEATQRPPGRPMREELPDHPTNSATEPATEELTGFGELVAEAYRAAAAAQLTNAVMNVDQEPVAESDDDQTSEMPTPDPP